ncbi:nuclear transport factor 2 family protein [Tsukamurella tyrosinosolvens]|uniref:DUF4440 domain-containing protein n=1 Tax=Tsukamurella tyrosinosolvens TaxID=57704 RepID=A0A1H5CBN1_TSUTY|nr:nuclear transport factor 2 family protein [Tsukamurella tyrosinosolvens]KXO92740.1 hypothetical protein AXK58_19280 [Tsukamurella tyrosinosolvens]KXP01790.1 hypothetical protein AXK59_22330 [Tsukamurella tyrosinosolvens]KZL94980.1 hypothetical protein AXX05_10170 [Tsukamurella tyrosinosolvens]MCA4997783.1 nuclear transport factor 2 family protein [Tsukamurella tyrosinosolvens]SEB29330.1 conserved hypothetical protein [Tsukamurella tyrosinosolvens]
MSTELHRPALDHRDPDADAAVERLVSVLQAGFDSGDADQYDSTFADDILWGTPKGQWLAGFPALNSAHHRMMGDTPVEPASRFEVIGSTHPAPDVVVAQVCRTALNGGFSEVAMYVLVRRADRWWVAAAQNTPVSAVLPPIDPV